MQSIAISKVKQGEFIKRKEGAKKVYVRGIYDRSTKRYICYDFDDINSYISLGGQTIVYVDFEF